MAITSTTCQAPNCNNPRDLKQRSSLCIMHRVRRSRFKSYNLPSEGSQEVPEINSFEKIERNTKSKGKICCISNCKGKIYNHGTICSKHHWRKRRFNSYDLPDHQGEPSQPVITKLPDGIVYRCTTHGDLSLEDVYLKKYKENTHYKCKKCIASLHIKIKYKGMNGLDDYDLMLAKQDGVCAICKRQNTTTRNGQIKRFAIDHCHNSKEVRGLLCAFCNALIGYARDNIQTLEAATAYLKLHQSPK